MPSSCAVAVGEGKGWWPKTFNAIIICYCCCFCRLLVKRKCYETAAVANAAAASSLDPRRASFRLFSSFSVFFFFLTFRWVGEWVSISWRKHVSVFVVEEIFEGSRVGRMFPTGCTESPFQCSWINMGFKELLCLDKGELAA